MNWISVPLLSYVVVLCLSTLNAVKESNKWGFLSHHILLKLFLKLKALILRILLILINISNKNFNYN